MPPLSIVRLSPERLGELTRIVISMCLRALRYLLELGGRDSMGCASISTLSPLVQLALGGTGTHPWIAVSGTS